MLDMDRGESKFAVAEEFYEVGQPVFHRLFVLGKSDFDQLGKPKLKQVPADMEANPAKEENRASHWR